MHTLKQHLSLIACAAWLHGMPATAADLDMESATLVDRIVLAYGGAAAIERTASVYAEGAIHASMRNDHGPYQRWLLRPRKLRVEIDYQRGAEHRILNGDQVWRSDKGSALKAVSGPGALAVVYQYKQLDLPYGLLKGSYRLRYAGRENLGGMETDVLDAQDAEGPPMRIHVDGVNHLIVQVSGRIEVGGAMTELAAEFSDYRPVEGVPMPFRIRNYAGGMAVSETLMQRYSLHPGDDATRFGATLQ